jgi:hypothetical protein
MVPRMWVEQEYKDYSSRCLEESNETAVSQDSGVGNKAPREIASKMITQFHLQPIGKKSLFRFFENAADLLHHVE